MYAFQLVEFLYTLTVCFSFHYILIGVVPHFTFKQFFAHLQLIYINKLFPKFAFDGTFINFYFYIDFCF